MTSDQRLSSIKSADREDPAEGSQPLKLADAWERDSLLKLDALLKAASTHANSVGKLWKHSDTAKLASKHLSTTFSPASVPDLLRRIKRAALEESGAIFSTGAAHELYLGSSEEVLKLLPDDSVDCIVTSPPYYGQRDYEVTGQIGLEQRPQDYVDSLLRVFREAKRVLKPTGSLWVNLGDTYWSGKGRPQGPDRKQRNRRFLRPQDCSGPRPLCAPKQQLLIPHRFAIAMQDDGWLVRNDNVWHKANPTPDPARDRSASAHEYMFHFVLHRRYYYDFTAVAVPSQGHTQLKPPPSVWTLHSRPSFKKHIAVFPEALVRIPVKATLPSDGVILDPFCGSGTALAFAISLGEGRRGLGIDISLSALSEADEILTRVYAPSVPQV